MERFNKIAKFGRKVMYWTVALILIAFAIFVYFRFYFVFGEGVKSGQLNFVVKKGVIFKTYEGRMIQVGYRSDTGGIQSNEFEFSVTDPEVAKVLEANSGRSLDLRYKEYNGTLPWRGMSRYIVVGIDRIHEQGMESSNPPAPATIVQ